MFISLASEEIEHAERLFKAGFNAIEEHKPGMYSMDTGKDGEEHMEECKIIWDWNYRLMNDKITELKYKISSYKR